jgi:voltage-gated potassium channel
VFIADYALRLTFSGDRWAFVRGNLIDLVAILPADMFRAARTLRLLRLLRLLRATAVLWRVSATVRAVLGTNALGWVLAATAWWSCSGRGRSWSPSRTSATSGTRCGGRS